MDKDILEDQKEFVVCFFSLSFLSVPHHSPAREWQPRLEAEHA